MNMDMVYKVGMIVSAVIAALIVLLNALAPLTKTEWDNRALKVLVWIHDVVLKMLLPQHVASVKTTDKV